MLACFSEEQESPRARALDTVLVLDTSDSVVKDHLDQLKTVVHTFIDGQYMLQNMLIRRERREREISHKTSKISRHVLLLYSFYILRLAGLQIK